MILAIERDPLQMENLTRWTEAHGHHLLCASSVVQALRWLQTVRPDLILVDVAGLHGFEVYRWLRTDLDYHDVPVIFLAALDQTWFSDQVEIIALNRVLVGPITPEKLGAHLNELFGWRAFNSEALRQSEAFVESCSLRNNPRHQTARLVS